MQNSCCIPDLLPLLPGALLIAAVCCLLAAEFVADAPRLYIAGLMWVVVSLALLLLALAVVGALRLVGG